MTHPKPRDGISITRNPTLISNCRGSGSPSSPNSPTVTNPPGKAPELHVAGNDGAAIQAGRKPETEFMLARHLPAHLAAKLGSRIPIAPERGYHVQLPHPAVDLALPVTDGDGRFDRGTVFADKMVMPEGALWHGGAFGSPRTPATSRSARSGPT